MKNSNQVVEILIKSKLFDKINNSEIKKVLENKNFFIKNFKKDEIIIYNGENIKNINILISGTLEIYKLSYKGNKSLITKILPSELFGEAFAILPEINSTVEVVALENVDILSIKYNHFVKIIESNRELMRNFIEIIATKNRILNEKLEILSKRTTREKLLTFLYNVGQQNNKKKFLIDFNKQELADYLGIDRTGLSKEISKLKKEKIIENDRKKYELLEIL